MSSRETNELSIPNVRAIKEIWIRWQFSFVNARLLTFAQAGRNRKRKHQIVRAREAVEELKELFGKHAVKDEQAALVLVRGWRDGWQAAAETDDQAHWREFVDGLAQRDLTTGEALERMAHKAKRLLEKQRHNLRHDKTEQAESKQHDQQADKMDQSDTDDTSSSQGHESESDKDDRDGTATPKGAHCRRHNDAQNKDRQPHRYPQHEDDSFSDEERHVQGSANSSSWHPLSRASVQALKPATSVIAPSRPIS